MRREYPEMGERRENHPGRTGLTMHAEEEIVVIDTGKDSPVDTGADVKADAGDGGATDANDSGNVSDASEGGNTTDQNVAPDVQRVNEIARAKGIPIATVTETLSPASDSFEQWQVAELEGLATALHAATGR